MTELTLLQRIEELERKMAQMVIRGKVCEVDYPKQRARVEYGKDEEGNSLKTPWLRWKPIRAGKASIWWPLEVGEAVTVLSPGDVDLGEILPSSYSIDNPAPSDNENLFAIQFVDGSEIKHDSESGNYDAHFKGDANISVDGDVNINSVGAVNIQSDSNDIQMNGGTGVVTGQCICPYTGKAHADVSQKVKAGK